MKTAALITKHGAYNYGAVFQSYATQYVIESLGVNCEIIDYQTKRCIEENKLFTKSFTVSDILHNVRNTFGAKTFLARKNNFCEYMNRYYNLTDEMFTVNNIATLSQEKYDYFVTGSDQTFNLNLAGESGVEEQKPYFWNFLNNKNKIAFASSIGEHIGKITDDQKEWLKEQFESYNSMAVREENLADYVEKLTNNRPEVIVDPTLLLNSSEWDKTAKPTKFDDEDYILFYTVMSEPWVIEYVKKLSEKTGLKVLAPHPKNRFEMSAINFYRVDYYGPGEFLSLVKNAKLVVATSFHGTAFSINYNRPFLSLVLGEGNRINSLLSLCGLQDRAVTESTKDREVTNLFDIDYSFANRQLELEKTKSINYLKRALEIE